jgi:hypothetical protein
LIRDKPYAWCPAVRPRDYKHTFEETKWEYFAGDLSAGTIYDYSIKEQWLTHPRLDLIMQDMARRVVANTARELGDAWKNRAALDMRTADSEQSTGAIATSDRPMLYGRPPQRHVRFKPGATPAAYQIAKQSDLQGHLETPVRWPADPTFYVIDPATVASADAREIGSSYLLVVGADYATYEALTNVQRQVHEFVEGHLTHVKKKGNPTGQVLIATDDVIDIGD